MLQISDRRVKGGGLRERERERERMNEGSYKFAFAVLFCINLICAERPGDARVANTS